MGKVWGNPVFRNTRIIYHKYIYNVVNPRLSNIPEFTTLSDFWLLRMSGIIIYRGWIPLFTQLDGIMWWSSMVYHKFIAPNSNRWPNNWWSNSFHETTLWVLPPGTFLGWSMFIHPKILLYCSMYGLFIQHHPTKWHQCWWFHAASLETRNPRGLMVPSGPPTSFHPILDMAQFSLTESLPPQKKMDA